MPSTAFGAAHLLVPGLRSMASAQTPRLVNGGGDLLRSLHPAAPRAQEVLIRSPAFYRLWAEFSGFAQGDGLVTPPDLVSMIGTLLPIAPCGRSSL